MKTVKKLFAPAAMAMFVATMIGTSYAQTPGAVVSDAYTAYNGETSTSLAEAYDYVLHLEYGDYVLHLEWRGMQDTVANLVGDAANDKMFDAK